MNKMNNGRQRQQQKETPPCLNRPNYGQAIHTHTKIYKYLRI